MGQVDARLSTGCPGLDEVIRGVIPGDNIVWQVRAAGIDGVYKPYACRFARHALGRGVSVHWFAFQAQRNWDLPPDLDEVECHILDAEQGFEHFIAHVHEVIERHGSEGVYIFDCLSDLTADWYSDAMLANFYMLTCPLVYDVGGLAFFSIIRHRHSVAATVPIFDTAQVVIDAYIHQGDTYLHPVRVQHRHHATMHMLHQVEGEALKPVASSAVVADVLAARASAEVGTARSLPDVWHQVFHHAERMLASIRAGDEPEGVSEETRERLLRMVISRDERVLDLVRAHFSMDDLLEIGRRCIGTGLIGGKAVGMLLARAILRNGDQELSQRLEHHDSFFVCSDVYYSYLVHNGIWWVRMRQGDSASLLRDAKRARQRILTGTFPPDTVRQIERMLSYFGQSPIIVRSSSLLEDNFGNAFAGKYESVFCVNQGMRDQRLRNVLSAIRTIYASAMSDEALRYRQSRGLLERDEQMALLVQRVSGTMHGNRVFPHLAGVALSHNPFVWDHSIDPRAGMMRVVMGLGTRAVDRADDDYTRIVALNQPQRSPEISQGQTQIHAQHKADILDLSANQLVSVPVRQLLNENPDMPVALLSSIDPQQRAAARARGLSGGRERVLDFRGLLAESCPFVDEMRRMLRLLEAAYQHPVDVEFTANFAADGSYRMDLVQCRPLQFLGHQRVLPPPPDIAPSALILTSPGPVVGQSRDQAITHIILVVPSPYAELPQRSRYTVARMVGKAVRACRQRDPESRILLIGPGRWGTTTPSLGVPVSFGEIAPVEAICEVMDMGGGLVPDVSLGTHFFNDLVEEDILYLAHYPGREGHLLDLERLIAADNILGSLLGEPAAELLPVLRVIPAEQVVSQGGLRLHADSMTQHATLWNITDAKSP
ncbi:MAG: pyruvate, phosphate dikinase [Planctomycetota bacterium]|nr:MAG: pyruvate, phosphate dikinase [Planctomycetota bacterium]